MNDKLKRESELKTLLGVTFVDEIKQDFTDGLNQIKLSVAYVEFVSWFLYPVGLSVFENEFNALCSNNSFLMMISLKNHDMTT